MSRPVRALRACLIVASAAAAIACGRSSAPDASVGSAVRLALVPPADAAFGAGPDVPFDVAIGPDSRRMVFAATRGGRAQLWVRRLDEPDAEPIPDTEGATQPFWSPDGRRIGFFTASTLETLDLATHRRARVASIDDPRGAAWTSDDLILVGRANGGLVRVTLATGAATAETTLDGDRQEQSHRWPRVTSDGRGVAYLVRVARGNQGGIYVAPIGGGPAVRIATTDASAEIVGDLLLFVRDATLMAQRLGEDARAAAGPAVPLLPRVGIGPTGRSFVAASRDVLVTAEPGSPLRELRWVDRTGAAIGSIGQPAEYWSVRLAPDGRQVAVSLLEPLLRTLDVWVLDTGTPRRSQITTTLSSDTEPVWSPDGARLAFASGQNGRQDLFVVAPASGRLEVPLFQSNDDKWPTDWSEGGDRLVFTAITARAGLDIGVVSTIPTAAAAPQPPAAPAWLAGTTFNERDGRLSPDGRWLAYASDESGRFEIYLKALDGHVRHKVSADGGLQPAWRHDGRELYYLRGGTSLMAVPVDATGTPAVPARLLESPIAVRAYDVTADGDRFLLNLPAEGRAPRPYAASVHWRALVPPAAVPARRR